MRAIILSALAVAADVPPWEAFASSAGAEVSAKSPASALENPEWPDTFPLSAADFTVEDKSVDSLFYHQPRYVSHLDRPSVNRLQEYYRRVLPRRARVLDLMSSHTSHLAEGAGADVSDGHFERVVGLGLSRHELAGNKALHEYHIFDLNAAPEPLILFSSESFDVVICSLSVEYLRSPLKVFTEIYRVLRPGGLVVITWSNRNFVPKTIEAWNAASPSGRMWIAASYLHYAGGFTPPQAEDLSPPRILGDRLYAITARKEGGDGIPARDGIRDDVPGEDDFNEDVSRDQENDEFQIVDVAEADASGSDGEAEDMRESRVRIKSKTEL